jgi:hypothetical protein
MTFCDAFIEKFRKFDISGMTFFYIKYVFGTNRQFVNGLANLFASGRLSFFTFLDLGHRGHSVGKRTRICVFREVTIKTIIKRPTNDHLWRDFSGLDQEASSLSKSFRGHYLFSNFKIHRETTRAGLSGLRIYFHFGNFKTSTLRGKTARI